MIIVNDLLHSLTVTEYFYSVSLLLRSEYFVHHHNAKYCCFKLLDICSLDAKISCVFTYCN